MTRDILKRLKKLESHIAQKDEKFFPDWHKFMFYALAHYLGNAGPPGHAMLAYARALGYRDSFEFLSDFRVDDNPNIRERAVRAKAQLLAKFGVSANDELAVIGEALDRMANGLSESVRPRLP
jgi:hypothetical protein